MDSANVLVMLSAIASLPVEERQEAFDNYCYNRILFATEEERQQSAIEASLARATIDEDEANARGEDHRSDAIPSHDRLVQSMSEAPATTQQKQQQDQGAIVPRRDEDEAQARGEDHRSGATPSQPFQQQEHAATLPRIDLSRDAIEDTARSAYGRFDMAREEKLRNGSEHALDGRGKSSACGRQGQQQEQEQEQQRDHRHGCGGLGGSLQQHHPWRQELPASSPAYGGPNGVPQQWSARGETYEVYDHGHDDDYDFYEDYYEYPQKEYPQNYQSQARPFQPQRIKMYEPPQQPPPPQPPPPQQHHLPRNAPTSGSSSPFRASSTMSQGEQSVEVRVVPLIVGEECCAPVLSLPAPAAAGGSVNAAAPTTPSDLIINDMLVQQQPAPSSQEPEPPPPSPVRSSETFAHRVQLFSIDG